MEYYGNLNVSPYAQLYHHGVIGQKWGVKNGPPYPLDSAISTGSSLKERSGFGGVKMTDGGLFRKKKKNRVETATQEEVKPYNDAQKERMLRVANPKEVKAHYTELSTVELTDAVTRMRNLEEINKRIPKEPTVMDKLNDATQKAQSISNFLNASVKAYNSSKSVYLILKELKNKKANPSGLPTPQA